MFMTGVLCTVCGAQVYFISILMMTQGTQKTDDRGTATLGTNQLQPVEWEGMTYCSSTVIG